MVQLLRSLQWLLLLANFLQPIQSAGINSLSSYRPSPSSKFPLSSKLHSLVGYLPQWPDFWYAAHIDLDVMAIRHVLDYDDVIFVGDLDENNDADAKIKDEYKSHANQSLPSNSIYRIQNIYERGAFSQTYANLTVYPEGAISQFLPQGATLVGISQQGHFIPGKVMQDTPVGSTHISFQYMPRQEGHLAHCFVGGLPVSEQILSGCLMDDKNGRNYPILIRSNSQEVMYAYNYPGGNRNARTLAQFSQTALERMHNCFRCPYKTYEKFFRYYGTHDYAHQIVLAALDQDYTDFTNGNLDFTTFTIPGRIGKRFVLFCFVYLCFPLCVIPTKYMDLFHNS
jgi:hypothetical protein